MSGYITENRQVPIKKECDVFVAGGGFAGVSAALSAARMGKKVILADRGYMLGGLGTAGLVIIFLPLCDGMGNQLCYGICEELFRLSIKYGAEAEYPTKWLDGGTKEERKNGQRFHTRYNPSIFAISMEQLLLSENAEIMYGSLVCGASVENGGINSVIIENKSGRSAISAKSFVDATGDFDLGVLAGAPYKVYEPGNILAAWHYYSEKDGCNLRCLGASDSSAEKMLVNRRFGGIDADEASVMMQMSHKIILDDVLQFRKKAPEHTPVTIPTIPQLRMTRRLDGEYTLDESEDGASFSDSIGMTGDWRKCGPKFEIPLKTLYSSKIRNLITAGRSISVTDSMWDITRVIPPCIITGEAAGIAAALSDDFGTLDVGAVQKRIRETGGKCTFGEIDFD